MNEQIAHHFKYYLSLGVLLVLGVFIILQLSYDRKLQIEAVFLLSFLYVIWGVLHHLIEHDITAKIVIEYILMGALGLIILVFFLQGAML